LPRNHHLTEGLANLRTRLIAPVLSAFALTATIVLIVVALPRLSERGLLFSSLSPSGSPFPSGSPSATPPTDPTG